MISVNNGLIGVTQLLMPQTHPFFLNSTLRAASTRRAPDIQSIVVLVGNIADTLSGSVRVDLSIQHADDDG